MRCADLVELISAYADRQTMPAQTEFVEAHLACCRTCRDTLRRHREVARLLQHADEADHWQVPDLRLRVIHASGGHRRHSPWLRGGLVVGLISSLALTWALAGSTPIPHLAQVAQATATPSDSRIAPASSFAPPLPITVHQPATDQTGAHTWQDGAARPRHPRIFWSGRVRTQLSLAV
jgi:hypothetical protein